MKNKILLSFWIIASLVQAVFPCTVNISNIKAKAIYGIVIDETESPIPNAKVQIYKSTDDEKILAQAIADENGRFEIKNFPAGKYLIRAKAENFAYTTSSLKLRGSSAKAVDKEMVFVLVPSAGCTGWVEMKKIKNRSNGSKKR